MKIYKCAFEKCPGPVHAVRLKKKPCLWVCESCGTEYPPAIAGEDVQPQDINGSPLIPCLNLKAFSEKTMPVHVGFLREIVTTEQLGVKD